MDMMIDNHLLCPEDGRLLLKNVGANGMNKAVV
jgi:hypothetical protein